jgi:hypothetical protein
MVKDLKKFKFDPDVIPHATWEIFMAIEKAINVDEVVNFLKANNLWAFVYTKQHPILPHYFLHGYIMLPYPRDHDWFVQNLGEDGEYTMTNENPNAFRTRHIYTLLHPPFNYVHHTEILFKIEKGSYIPHTGPYMYTTKPHSKYNY